MFLRLQLFIRLQMFLGLQMFCPTLSRHNGLWSLAVLFLCAEGSARPPREPEEQGNCSSLWTNKDRDSRANSFHSTAEGLEPSLRVHAPLGWS